MMEYKIEFVHGNNCWETARTLEKRVSALTEKGWRPLGVACCLRWGTARGDIDYWYWYQTLIKENSENIGPIGMPPPVSVGQPMEIVEGRKGDPPVIDPERLEAP